MLSYTKNYFRNCRLARMSNGEVCLIRDQGLVKGGRGLKHHEVLIAFSMRGLAAKFRRSPKMDGSKPAALRRPGRLIDSSFSRSPLDQRPS
jgi:hypothetical protein